MDATSKYLRYLKHGQQRIKIKTKYYNNILNSHQLLQVIAKPTRRNTSLIDHFITSTPEKIKLNDVLSCCEISDHDGPYIGMNARIERYQPRFKYIRVNSKLIIEDFKADSQKLSFSSVYVMEDPENKLDIFNTLVTECIDRHAPLKRIKCTRPPVPSLKCLNIQQRKSDIIVDGILHTQLIKPLIGQHIEKFEIN